MENLKNIIAITRDFIDAAPTKQDTTVSKYLKLSSLILKLSDRYAIHKYKSLTKNFVPNGNSLLLNVLADKAVEDFTKIIHSNNDPNLTFNQRVLKEVEGVGKFYHSLDLKGNFDLSQNIFLDKDFNFEFLSKLFYEYYGSKIFIDSGEKTKEYTENGYNYKVRRKFEPVVNKDKIITTSTLEEVMHTINKPGTYMFFGRPGTGKSSFIFSKNFINKKCVKILASDFIDNDFVIHCLKIFKPEILLVEELDKYPFSVGNSLIFLERVRNEKMTIVITANDISNFHSALLRPGRIDAIVEFDLPSEKDIRKIVNEFSPSNDIEEKEKFIELMVESEFTHAYVTDMSKKLKGNFENIKKYTLFLQKLEK